MSFSADKVYAGSPDGEIFMLAFSAAVANGSDGPALMIQAGAPYNGHHYCFVLDTQATYYGGLVDWKCQTGSLELTLTSEAARELGVNDLIVITYDPKHAKKVRAAMRAIFDES